MNKLQHWPKPRLLAGLGVHVLQMLQWQERSVEIIEFPFPRTVSCTNRWSTALLINQRVIKPRFGSNLPCVAGGAATGAF